ncbi:hypothetical protein ACEI87_10145 [Clostridioides difficile]
MIKECLEIFEKKFNEEGMNLILKDFRLKQGAYIQVKKDYTYDVVVIDKNYDIEKYKEIIEKDYLSLILDSNKSIKSKRIMSNNYLSFITKKKFIDILNNDIDEYFDIFANPSKKYKLKLEKEIILDWDINAEKVNKNKIWIKENLINITKDLKLGAEDYIKVFFYGNIDTYREESEKYFKLNLFLKNEYCILNNNELLGVPGNNITLNLKKPFLLNRTRKNDKPYLLDYKNAYLEKLFFDYLENEFRIGNNMIYISDDEIIPAKNTVAPRMFAGYLLVIGIGKSGAEILDCKTLTGYNPRLVLKFEDILNIDYTYYGNSITDEYKNLYKETKTLKELELLIDKLFFNNCMKFNYFNNDIKESNYLSRVQARELQLIKEAIFDFVYLGQKTAFKAKFEKSFLNIIEDSIKQEKNLLAKHQYNLKEAIKEAI